MKSFPVFFFAFLSAFLIFMGITIVLAWTEPVSAPPADNVSAPVNVSGTTQYKSGALGVGGIFRGYNTAIFDSNVGIGTSSPAYKLDVVGNVAWSGALQKGSVPWSRLTGFPSACPSGQYVTAVGGSLTCETPATSSSATFSFPIIVQPSGFSSLNADQTLGETNKGWISKKFFLTKHIANQLKFKIYFRADNDQTLNMRLCYGAAVTHETVPEYGLKTTSCGTEIKDIGGTWQSRNRQAKLFEGIATLPSPDNQYKYVVLQTSVTRSGGYAEEGSYYWGTLHYLIEE